MRAKLSSVNRGATTRQRIWAGGRYVLPNADPPPSECCQFEKLVARLGLAEQEFQSSSALKIWVHRNLNHRYVPEWLLKAWGMEAMP